MTCRSRSRSPVEANSTHRVDYIYLDGEIDIEFPMLTDDDIDCIVQDSDSGGASLGSIEKPSAIDAIQKHVEESLLFLDEEISTLHKSENTPGALHQKLNKVLEKPESDDTVMKDVDDSLRHIEMDANDKNTGEPLQNSTLILKQDNKNDALLSDEQQKDKIEVESVTAENTVDSLLEGVNEETSNIPEIMETNDDILSLEDNPISDSVLNKIDKDTAMNKAQEETSGISEQTVKFIVSQEDNALSNCAVNEIDIDTEVNLSLEQKSDILLLTDSKKVNIVSLEHNTTSDSVPNKMNKDTTQKVTSDTTEQIDTSEVIVSQEDNLPSDSAVHETDTVVNISLGQKSDILLLTGDKKANIVSLEDTPTSDTVLNEINADAMNNDSENKPSDLSRQINDNKVSSALQEDNPLSLSTLNESNTNATVLNEINADAMNNDSENKPSELLKQSDGKKVRSALQEDNPSSLSTLNETDTDATIYDSDLKSSDISEQSAAIKFCNISHEDNPLSDNMLNETETNAEIVNVQEKTSDISTVLHEGISLSDSLLDATDADVTMNYDSQDELRDNSDQIITHENGNVAKKQSPSGSMLSKIDLAGNMDDTQEDISEIPQQNDEIDGSNVSQEKNSFTEDVLDETDGDASINGPQEETTDVSEQSDINETSNISQEDNIVLNETDTDAAINVSPEIVEQIEIVKVNNIYQYKVLNETDTDVTINDSQEEISDISELIDSRDVSMVSQENLPSDSVCKTDTDATMNDSQEEMNDMKTYDKDDTNISEKDDGPLNSELDKTDAAVLKRCEADNKTIETSGSQDNLKSIIKESHEKSVTEPQKDAILVKVESKEMNSQTDEPRQFIENTTTDDKENDKLPQLKSNVQKTGLPENETQVMKEINEIGQTNQKLPIKDLVWEIKSIKPETEQQGKKGLLQKERSQEQNVTENPTKKNPLVRAVPTEDVTECSPAKRSRFQPVWTTNPLNDEDKPKAEQGTCSDKTAMDIITDHDATAQVPPENPYIISQDAKKQLQTWLLKSGLAHPRPKYMQKLANVAKWNKAVIKMAPIPKDYKLMDVFKIIRDQTATYERDISKGIQYIHIDKYDENFNAAYIKWRDIDKLLVVKAFQILVTTSFTIDGVVKKPLFKYDDRSIIDWNENERPILDLKDGNIAVPKTVSTPVVTPIANIEATTSATPTAKHEAATVPKSAETPVPKPVSRPPPPAPFITGEMNFKDRMTYGLSSAFMEYYNLKPPIMYFVFVMNLDMSQPIEKYHRIFSTAGSIVEMEVMPPTSQDQQLSSKLRIAYNHGLEAVQALSMFHEQVIYGRLIEVKMGHISTRKKKPLVIEGCNAVGPGLGINGLVMKDIRSNVELSKLRARTKVQLDNFKDQITALRQKLSAAIIKLEQAKREEDKRRYKEEKKQIHSQYESQNKQTSIDAMSAITKAIASSVQANVITMLGIQPNQQQNQNANQTSAPVNNQPSGMSQNQSTPRAPSNWTANENTVTALPNTATALPNTATTLPNTATALPNTATALQNPNMYGQTSMENAFQNLGRELQRYQNTQDPYSYYASMQQAYMQYGYNMDPTMMQAHAYMPSGTTYMQPAMANVQQVPAGNTSNMLPTTQKTESMPTIISNQPVSAKPSNPTQRKAHTESKTVFPPLPTTNKNDTVYDIQKPPLRFNKSPANVGNITTAQSRFDVQPTKVRQTTAAQCKVPEIPLAIPTISQPAVKIAFKMQKPIVPPKEIKPSGIHIKIPSVLPETVPLVLQNPRTLEKNSVQRKLIKLAGELRGESWINKQIREMRKNSKSPERIRKSPEKIKSPDHIQKTLPKVILPPKAVKRFSRSPERRRFSRSPVRRNSRSPVRRRSRSTERRRVSRSPKRRMSRSPTRRRSRSPIRRRSRSTERRRTSRSPIRRRSRSIERRRMSRSPKRRMSRSPIRRRSRSTERRRMSRSPKRRISRSPVRRMSKSPIRRRSKSPIRRKSRSPVRRISKSPVRKISRSPVGRVSRSPVTELGPKSTPRPAYEPDGASRDIINLDHKTANYNFIREMERDLANTSVNFSFLPPSVTTEDLTDKMGEIGELLQVRAFGMGKALVVFKFRHDAETCIEMYNMAKVDGQTIEVRWASIDDMLDEEEKILVFN